MSFLMQIIFIVLPSNMAAVQNLYSAIDQMKHNYVAGPSCSKVG